MRVGDQWRFSDPASKQAPYGMLRPQEEGGPFRDRRRYGEFLFVRSVEMRAAAIQPREYGRLRDFYGRVQAADPSAVVLVKQ